MSKVGSATLPLHGGNAPAWLFKRMKKLGKPLFDIIYDMEGPEGILRRLSNTYWFQGLSCVLGFDWHSSGTTTVLGGVLKEILNPKDHGLLVVGGKGKASLKVKEEIHQKAKELDYNEDNIKKLNEISRLVAKVDNAAIQDGFNLYHHNMIFSERSWSVVQQGLDNNVGKARRYHWLSEDLTDYLDDPHTDISTQCLKNRVLDMATNKSEKSRKVSLDLIAEGPRRIKSYLSKLRDRNQTRIDDFFGESKESFKILKEPQLDMPIPFTLKWESLDMAKELSVRDYTELLKIKGIGPGTIRSLALISEFIWGEPPSWKDPAKYSFTVGGKDGIPYPVDLDRMEKCAMILETAVDQSRLDKKEKLQALKRLHKFESRKNPF